MPQVIIEQPSVPPITVPLSRPEIHFGRADDNEVVLVAEEVSRHHAKVYLRGDQYILEDLKSLNGTYVNQQRVVQRVLSHMDEVWFGSKCRMVFRDDTRLGKPQQKPKLEDSTLTEDLNKIRDEMDRVGNNLTMIGKHSTIIPGTAQAPAVPQPSAAELVAMSRAYRRLSALYHASKVIASAFDLPKRLAAVLDTAIEVLEADRGFVMLWDDESKNLMVTVARQMGKDLEASSPSMGVAGRAAIDGTPVLLADSSADSQFSGRESIIQQRIASAMCVPLKTDNRILGSVYVDTKRVGQKFSQEDLELFASLAAQSSMAIDNSRLYEQMLEEEKKRANLGRFLSPGIVDLILKENAHLELGGAKRVVTTMFCDIRGFTMMSERTTPDELVSVLNEHFTRMTEIVFRHRGTLDKYIGDEVMAIWGAPLTYTDDEISAISAALEMQEATRELNLKRLSEGRPEFNIGIGIDTGEVVAGFIGSPERMDFTVVGDRVNTASRLCSLAGPSQVVIGESTYQVAKHRLDARPIGSVMLKGKRAPVHAYEVLRLLPS